MNLWGTAKLIIKILGVFNNFNDSGNITQYFYTVTLFVHTQIDTHTYNYLKKGSSNKILYFLKLTVFF